MKRTLIVLFAVLLSFAANAQTKYRVTGVVMDTYGEPIIGACVLEVGTFNGTMTDINGCYTLEVSDCNSYIEASCLGYIAQQKEYRPVLYFILEDDGDWPITTPDNKNTDFEEKTSKRERKEKAS